MSIEGWEPVEKGWRPKDSRQPGGRRWPEGMIPADDGPQRRKPQSAPPKPADAASSAKPPSAQGRSPGKGS
jgi:hypothetical protein